MELEKTELLYIQELLRSHRTRQQHDGFSGRIPDRLIEKLDVILSQK